MDKLSYYAQFFGFVSASIHFIQALIVGILIIVNKDLLADSRTFHITLETTHWDTINRTHFMEPPEKVMGFQVPVAAMGFFLLSGTFQLVANSVFANDILSNIRVRYIEYSISAPLMFVIIALEVGIHDGYSLICLTMLISLTNVLGLLSDFMQVENPNSDLFWVPHGLGWWTCISSYFLIYISYLYNIRVNGNPPWFVHVIVVFMTLLFISFGAVQSYDLTARMKHSRGMSVRMNKKLRVYLRVDTENNNPGTVVVPTTNVTVTPPVVNVEPIKPIIKDNKLVQYEHLPQVAFAYDVLSLLAKTLLCWLALGPVLNGVF